eukprot:TRINITY_DN2862_c0_g1_i3.p1 TRINITY_DN2862_c0_g1~~TRINITY_DN2862_c0_g1_i3.p1  ORF type:complete len:470 (-),score=58.31 TRINITY_DN2862_c0_g1_i3:298-1602(-)
MKALSISKKLFLRLSHKYKANIVCRMSTTASQKSPDSFNAFITKDMNIQLQEEGPLAGLTLGVKDLYDVEGYVTGFGNPQWAATHDPATSTAPCVQTLLKAGVRLVGKTHMDELAYSLFGENVHYGTPRNPAASDRVPGGSSSGSAVCVGSGQADIGLGSDTAGSVRVPASFCGIWGFRPTHGQISLQGARPLAPSFDTVGWFTNSAELLQRVGKVLLDANNQQNTLQGWIVADDAFELAVKEVSLAIYEKVRILKQGIVDLLQSEPNDIQIASVKDLGDLTDWFGTFRTIQAREVWQCHGDWVSHHNPSFGPGVEERFEAASKVTEESANEARLKQKKIRDHLDELIGNGVLMIPTAPGPAPILNMPPQEADDYRSRALRLTCIAGLAGLPQLNIPIAIVDECPVGLGVIAGRGADLALLQFAVEMERLLKGR